MATRQRRTNWPNWGELQQVLQTAVVSAVRSLIHCQLTRKIVSLLSSSLRNRALLFPEGRLIETIAKLLSARIVFGSTYVDKHPPLLLGIHSVDRGAAEKCLSPGWLGLPGCSQARCGRKRKRPR